MKKWQFAYVDLVQVPRDNDEGGPETIRRTTDQIKALGQEGWEPVGQVVFSVRGIQYPQLMLKRPVE